MFGECHAHVIMDGLNFRHAVDLHREAVQDYVIENCFRAYRDFDISFVRDGGDNLGVSHRARDFAPEYGIDYRTPIFAIHRNGYYGGIVGFGFDDMKEYHRLVKRADAEGCDFIKIMISGIMDFAHAGVLSCDPLPEDDIREMIHIAHEEGFSVMAHVNGKWAVSMASHYGVDSVEHGNFIDSETLEIMAANHTLYVPTAATIADLLGCGRFPDEEVQKILDCAAENIRTARELGVPTALGSDAGAYMVPHGQGLVDEYRIFHDILSDDPGVDDWLRDGEALLRDKFRRGYRR